MVVFGLCDYYWFVAGETNKQNKLLLFKIPSDLTKKLKILFAKELCPYFVGARRFGIEINKIAFYLLLV